MVDPESKIGYVRLTQFQAESAQQLHDTLLDLQAKGMKGLIMDLRFNPGGLLNSAIDISDMFLQDGTIVSTKGRSAKAMPRKWVAHKETVIPPTMPVVVLVNQYSAWRVGDFLRSHEGFAPGADCRPSQLRQRLRAEPAESRR